MKRILMAIMAVAVAVTFSAPAFAGDPPTKDEKKSEKKEGHLVYGDPDKPKEGAEGKKKGGYTDTFGDEGKKDPKKPAEPGK